MLCIAKYHGCGNDFIILRESAAQKYHLPALIAALCDRHTGVGADGLILVRESPLTMLFYNCDGSPAPMCGNGIRCFGKFCLDEKIVTEPQFQVQTGAGIKTLTVLNREPFFAKVAMGQGDFSPAAIGVNRTEPALDYTLLMGGRPVLLDSFFLSTVHTVWFVENPEDPQTQKTAGEIGRHPFFPQGTNVNMVRVVDSQTIAVRTWERGVGMTLACGTGACAAALIAYRKGYCESQITVLLPKGRLIVQIGPDGAVELRGPAQRILKGAFDI